MKPAVYPVIANYPGQLFIMPKPSGDRLCHDLAYVRGAGAGLVVSLLEPAEATALMLGGEARACRDAGLEFVNFPIADFGLPDQTTFARLVSDLRARLIRGEAIAVHCRAGIGRSGMLVCCVLGGFVGSAAAAVDLVSAARGVPVPDTAEQRRFIETLLTAPGGDP